MGVHRRALRHAVDEVAAAHLHRPVVLGRNDLGRADGALYLLGGAVADEQVVFGLDERHDVAVEGVARDAQALGDDDAAEAEDGDVGGAAADVDDHGTYGFRDLDAGPDGAGDRFLDEESLARTDLVSGLHHRAPLDLGDAAWYADHDVGPQEPGGAGEHLADERLEHLLGEGVVGDDAVGHGPHGCDVAGRAPEHPVRLLADRLDVGGALDHGDHRRLPEQHALALYMNPHVGRAEVYADHGVTLPVTSAPHAHLARGPVVL